MTLWSCWPAGSHQFDIDLFHSEFGQTKFGPGFCQVCPCSTGLQFNHQVVMFFRLWTRKYLVEEEQIRRKDNPECPGLQKGKIIFQYHCSSVMLGQFCDLFVITEMLFFPSLYMGKKGEARLLCMGSTQHKMHTEWSDTFFASPSFLIPISLISVDSGLSLFLPHSATLTLRAKIQKAGDVSVAVLSIIWNFKWPQLRGTNQVAFWKMQQRAAAQSHRWW